MIKILICCGAGMSSSFLTQKLQNKCEELGFADEFSFEFCSIEMLGVKNAVLKANEYDVVMCCPHLRLFIDKIVKTGEVTTPLYILPPQMYGTMVFEEVIQDAKDIIQGYKETKMNPFHFPGEDQPLKIRRSCAYRHLQK